MGRLDGAANWVKLEVNRGGVDVMLEFFWEVIRLIVLCKVVKRVMGYLDDALMIFYWNVYVPYVQGKHPCYLAFSHHPPLPCSNGFHIYAHGSI